MSRFVVVKTMKVLAEVLVLPVITQVNVVKFGGWKNEDMLFLFAIRKPAAYFCLFTAQHALRYFQQVPEKENPLTTVKPRVSCFSYFANLGTNSL